VYHVTDLPSFVSGRYVVYSMSRVLRLVIIRRADYKLATGTNYVFLDPVE
jgi:hypothetical protein